MAPRALLTALVGSLLAVAALLPAATAGSAAAAGAIPIPPDPRDLLIERDTGAPATPRPLPAQWVPRHPFMAPNERSNIHNDAYQTDASNGVGPLGQNPATKSTLFVGECASVTFDRRGRIVTVCVTITGATLRILDPKTLATIASYELPPRRGVFSFSNFSGGGYFYLDHRDRAVISTFDGTIVWVKVGASTLRKVREIDVSGATGGAAIQSALPDWSGRIWFVSQDGAIGMIDRGGAVHALRLPAGEEIANSFAIDESGGVFIVSTHALYRFDAVDGEPAVTWRKRYNRGERVKPGQVSIGSGTTPTLIGSAAEPGGGWIAITDNADPRMNVLVFRRGKAGPGSALCRQPVFARGRSADENSLIAVPGGLIAENNYGYAGPLSNGVARIPDTEPGLVRIDVDYANGGCHIAWENDTVRIPTVVAKVSLGTGLLYAYTHPSAAELPWKGLPLPALLAPDSWYFTGIDVRTGREVFSTLAGTGLGFNNNYAPVTLGPDGAAYVGVLGGLLRIADRG